MARKEAAIEAREDERFRKLRADVREIQKEMMKEGLRWTIVKLKVLCG